MRTFLAAAILFIACLSAVPASPIKADEEVVFFPSYGARVDSEHWELWIHGWIYEWERRPGVSTTFRKLIGLDEESMSEAEKALFAARTRLFLADAERDKKLSIHLAGRTYDLNPSDATGHFSAKIKVRDSNLVRSPEGYVTFRAVTARGDQRVFGGTLQLIEPEGISVVSDIDDTIKVSEILDRRKLLLNTFVKEFVPAPGMAPLYGTWATNRNIAFHYLSASPSQLFTPLEEFRAGNSFPAGSFHLRAFDWRTEFQNHSVPKKHKPQMLERLFTTFPKRKFLLVGDSGESDPEIYADIARRFPEQVIKILIRDVTGESSAAPRYKDAFTGLPSDRWEIFKHPSELGEVVLRK